MATIEEILNKMTDTDSIQEDIQFVIDEKFRTITVPSNGVVLGVTGDKNINVVTFKMQRFYNGFDMTDFLIRIHYTTPNNKVRYYTVPDFAIYEDKILFQWLIDGNVCQDVGNVKFSVRMFKVDEEGQIVQAFNTTIASAKVLEGMEATCEMESSYVKDELLRITIAYLNNHPEYIGATEEEAQKLNTVIDNLGVLGNLKTTNKTNIVSAINEIVDRRVINVTDSNRESTYYYPSMHALSYVLGKAISTNITDKKVISVTSSNRTSSDHFPSMKALDTILKGAMKNRITYNSETKRLKVKTL